MLRLTKRIKRRGSSDMSAVVVYESMYGNTRQIAEQIAEGLRSLGEVRVIPIGPDAVGLVRSAGLVVVGGPTHVHGMSSKRSRQAAIDNAGASDLTIDPDAGRFGLREWIDQLGSVEGNAAAAFDTRIDLNPVVTGRASRGIARRLRRHGYHLVVSPESFLVDKTNRLIDGELQRAVLWAEGLATAFDRYSPRDRDSVGVDEQPEGFVEPSVPPRSVPHPNM
jgi:hypothetical protein